MHRLGVARACCQSDGGLWPLACLTRSVAVALPLRLLCLHAASDNLSALQTGPDSFWRIHLCTLSLLSHCLYSRRDFYYYTPLGQFEDDHS